jgi:hypothetical protein
MIPLITGVVAGLFYYEIGEKNILIAFGSREAATGLISTTTQLRTGDRASAGKQGRVGHIGRSS